MPAIIFQNQQKQKKRRTIMDICWVQLLIPQIWETSMADYEYDPKMAGRLCRERQPYPEMRYEKNCVTECVFSPHWHEFEGPFKLLRNGTREHWGITIFAMFVMFGLPKFLLKKIDVTCVCHKHVVSCIFLDESIVISSDFTTQGSLRLRVILVNYFENYFDSN